MSSSLAFDPRRKRAESGGTPPKVPKAPKALGPVVGSLGALDALGGVTPRFPHFSCTRCTQLIGPMPGGGGYGLDGWVCRTCLDAMGFGPLMADLRPADDPHDDPAEAGLHGGPLP